MSKHLEKEMSRMEETLLRECALVEKNLSLALQSVIERDGDLARQVIDADQAIDRIEVETEEECLKIMALHQPVAVDLRMLIAFLKMNNDLERIGDLAVNIAQSAVYLAKHKPYPQEFDFSDMGNTVIQMLKDCVDALVNMDVDLAAKVCNQDDSVDKKNKETYKRVRAQIKDGYENVNQLIHLLSISRHLERIADHTTNISEDVIYMIKGEIIRHNVAGYLEED